VEWSDVLPVMTSVCFCVCVRHPPPAGVADFASRVSYDSCRTASPPDDDDNHTATHPSPPTHSPQGQFGPPKRRSGACLPPWGLGRRNLQPLKSVRCGRFLEEHHTLRLSFFFRGKASASPVRSCVCWCVCVCWCGGLLL
jgi:hypothetical protein